MLTKLNTTWFAFLVMGIIIFSVYFSGINGEFQFDDYPNIQQNSRLHIDEFSKESLTKALLASPGNNIIAKRPLSMITFGLNHYFFGPSPYSYKLTNIFIHIANCFALYWLCLLILQSLPDKKRLLTNQQFSFLVVLAWGVHPINLTAVLYVVQRMTSLSAFFVICSLGLYIVARNAIDNNQQKKGILYLLLVIVSALLGILAKQNAILVFIYIFLLEVVFFRTKHHSKNYKNIILIFFSIVVLIPFLLIIGYTIIDPTWFQKGYSDLPFGPYQRLITEFRIVWLYISWILLPNNQKLGYIHDDIPISSNLYDSTMPIIAGVGHLMIISILFYLWLNKKQPLFVLGCSLFYASHLIESTIYPLIITFEHRNYFGSFGVLLAILSIAMNAKNKYKTITLSTVGTFLFFLVLLTSQRAASWGKGLESALLDVQHHPLSAAAHYELARQYSLLKNTEDSDFFRKAKLHFEKSSKLDKYRGNSLFALIMLFARNNQPIPREYIDQLIIRARNNPFYPTHVTWLAGMVKCYKNKDCGSLKIRDIQEILQAMLDNKNIEHSSLSRSYTFLIAADILANIGKNYNQALAFSINAVESSPNAIQFSLNVVELALAGNDLDTAEQWINRIENQYSNLFPSEITELKARLSNKRMQTRNSAT